MARGRAEQGHDFTRAATGTRSALLLLLFDSVCRFATLRLDTRKNGLALEMGLRDVAHAICQEEREARDEGQHDQAATGSAE